MRKQRGYLNIGPSASEAFIGCGLFVLAISVVGGGIVYWLLPMLWEWVKPFIHQVTA